ncbi:glycosyltransferase family 2 protein [Soehngenia saccharolytica]|nr:glycosyltransferase family 2 protein [Soehngenia saccharolytica]
MSNDSKAIISIIIPAYNAEKTIKDTINSVQQQTFDQFEAIIVNDGSKDHTEEIVKEIISYDNRIKYFFQENSGVAAARNAGISNATGDYICFLDSDDYYDKYYLEKMYKQIIAEGSDICYCGYNLINGSVKKCKSNFGTNELLKNFILGRTRIHISCLLIKKDFLKKQSLLFPLGVQWGEDFEFICLLLSTKAKISFVNDYLSYYRVSHDEKQLSSFSLDKIDLDFHSINRLLLEDRINKNTDILDALIKYRLRALIIYRLCDAVNRKANSKDIIEYFNKYKIYFNEKYYGNGLRSLKLELYTLKLKRWMKNYERRKYND